MPATDRNLLRVSVYELLHVDEVPVAVTIDESVELAKAFGTDDSAKFINGLLGRIARESDVLRAEPADGAAAQDAEPANAEPADAGEDEAAHEDASPASEPERSSSLADLAAQDGSAEAE